MSTDDAPRNERCPQGNDSWCLYQVALANHETPGSHEDHPNNTLLMPDTAAQMVPVYERMSDEALL